MGRVVAVRAPSVAARRQVVVLLAVLLLCPVAALLIGDDPSGPVARARTLMDVERGLGIYVEPAVSDWALRHDAVLTAASLFYVFAHIAVAGWVLIWTWCLRRDCFRPVRDAFLWTQGLLIAIYIVFPTAPPRLVPGAGFADSLSRLWGREAADSAHLVQSQFAAVPSGHVAFALVAGITFARIGDMRWLRVFGWCYPVVVVAVTVLTANHLLLDAASAGLVVLVAFALARRTSTAWR